MATVHPSRLTALAALAAVLVPAAAVAQDTRLPSSNSRPASVSAGAVLLLDAYGRPVQEPARLARPEPAEHGPRPGPADRSPAGGLPRVAHDARRPDVRLQRPRVRAAHPALQRPLGRAGAQDGLHARGGLQPRGVGLAGWAAVRHDPPRGAHPDVLVPRRQEAPALRLRRGGARAARRALPPWSTAARPGPARRRRAVPPIRGYVFDAYGTLFDVHSVVEAGREITRDPAALSATWRQKQLEYTWLRALMGRYEDFWGVTEAALRHAIRRLGLTASDAQLRRLMDAYLAPACFPDVRGALERLEGRPRAILSNGSPRMLEAAVGSSGLGRYLQHVISVDAVRTYKPAPAVYALGPSRLGIPAGDPLFVSSNAWDVAGAKAFGYRVAWCNRGNAPEEELGLRADYVVRELAELPT